MIYGMSSFPLIFIFFIDPPKRMDPHHEKCFLFWFGSKMKRGTGIWNRAGTQSHKNEDSLCLGDGHLKPLVDFWRISTGWCSPSYKLVYKHH